MNNKQNKLLIGIMLCIGLLITGCGDDSSTSLLSPEVNSTTIYGSPEATENLGFDRNSNVLTSLTEVRCNGQRCRKPREAIIPGSINRDYSYIITPGAGGVSSFEIGVAANFNHNYNISMEVMPQGWDYDYIDSDDTQSSNMRSRHGNIIDPQDDCLKVIKFEGPVMTDSFQIAFKSNFNPKAVDWVTDYSSTDWSQPCGHGHGPVHSPHGFRVTGLYQGPEDVVPAPEPGPLQ
jgi:hypothetical protein